MLTSRMAAALTAGLLAVTLPVQGQKPALEEVLGRAGDYHASYATRISGVTLEERYNLIQLVAGRMQPPDRFTSDVVLLNVNGRLISLRDPFAIDNTPLRERTPRITDLLVAPTAEGWRRAQAYAAEQHFRFISDLILALNDPTLALQFVAREMRHKVAFKLEKPETMKGVPVLRVGFDEIPEPEIPFALRTRGNASASGRLWIGAADGVIHKSELRAASATESVVVTVTYAKDSTLDLWLPQKMNETYQWKEMDDVSSNRNVGAYGARLFFQADASYSNPRYTPIDLSKMRR